jgi:hypothetical protein
MYDQSRNDHKREKDVERNRDRKVWSADGDGVGNTDPTDRPQTMVSKQYPHRCISDVSQRIPPRASRGPGHVPLEER